MIFDILLADARPETLERLATELRRALREQNVRADIAINAARSAKRLARNRRALQPGPLQLRALYVRQRNREVMRLAERGWSRSKILGKIAQDFPEAPLGSESSISRIISAGLGGQKRARSAQDAREAPSGHNHTGVAKKRAGDPS